MSRKSFIDSNSQVPIFQQIVNETERLILVGELKEDEFLMSVREFAIQHTVNPNTVAKAYQALQLMDLVEAVRGKGLRVKKIKEKTALHRKEDLVKKKVLELIDLSNSLNMSNDDLVELVVNLGRKK